MSAGEAQATLARPAPENPATKGARHLLRLTLLIGVSALLLVAVGALGTRFGLWDWRVGFLAMTVQAAPQAAVLGVLSGLVALYVAAFAGWRRLWLLAALSLIAPLAVLFGFGGFRAGAAAVPAIHDYATDWSEPLMPSAAMLAARGPDANPILADPRMELGEGRPEIENWADDRVSRIGRDACPGARPVRLAEPPEAAQAKVRSVLQAHGLAISSEAPGRLEAVATSGWFRFRDDVMVRVRPEGGGARVDMRSVSRVGRSDLGANCKRLTALVSALGG